MPIPPIPIPMPRPRGRSSDSFRFFSDSSSSSAFALIAAALSWTLPAQAQAGKNARVAPDASRRLALAADLRAAPPARPARMACAPLGGLVFDPNGKPLVGATLLIKGTRKVYVTNETGQFRLTDPVYEGQVLTVQAAGFTKQEVPLTDCSLPRLVLDRAPEAHIQRNGKRAGQVIRLGRSRL